MRTRRATALALLLALLAVVALPGAAAAETLRDRQYGLDTIRAPEVWSVTRGDQAVVAVVDTGVQLEHPDLRQQLLRDGRGRVVGLDLVEPGTPPDDEHGHGTLVAGIVAAAVDQGIDGPGISGVAPGARIMPIRVLDADGAGRLTDVDVGIRWAADNGADVINLSLESTLPLPGDLVSSGLDDAVRYAWERGVIVVAAAGNTGTPFTDFRSSTPVLLVGATDREDQRAGFSDGGRSDMVMAPGVDIISTVCDPCGRDGRPTYGQASGTSFSAPHVAGAVALLRAAGGSPEHALHSLRSTAVDVPGGAAGTGHGRIDVAAAFGVTRTPTPPPPEPDDEPATTEDDGDAARDASPPPTEAPDERPSEAATPRSDDRPRTEAAEDPDADERDEPEIVELYDPRNDPERRARATDDTVGLPRGDGERRPLGALDGVAAGLVATSIAALSVVRRRYGLH